MARFYGPTTIFFDEIDALFCRGDEGGNEASKRVKGELLVQMDGVSEASSAGANAQQNEEEKKKRVIVIAATNKPWDLDEALIRRLEKRIYIPLPSEKGRKKLFEINMKLVKADDSIKWETLLKSTDGYSGADIANVCREAALMPIRKMMLENTNIEEIVAKQSQIDIPITMEDFTKALKNISKSVSTEFLTRYEKWMKEFGAT